MERALALSSINWCEAPSGSYGSFGSGSYE